MLKKVQNVFKEIIRLQFQNFAHSKELDWANVYHDTIRGKKWLTELSISPGRWAGNYSFFYILTRILSDYKPKKIIEFGLGESTKVISSFIENELHDSTHVVVEHNNDWITEFNNRFKVSKNSSFLRLSLEEKNINNYNVTCYSGIEEKVNEVFELYIIDGPLGSDRFSRFDICLLANKLTANDQFIIIIDDYEREGEQDTGNQLMKILESKKIKFHIGMYSGKNTQIVIASHQYQYATTL